MAKWTVKRLLKELKNYPEDAQVWLLTEFDCQHEDEMNDLGFSIEDNKIILIGHERLDLD